MLHRQGRMHPALSEYVNLRFYNRQLDIVPLPHQQQELEWKNYPQDEWHAFVARTRMGFFTVVPDEIQENDKSNRKEAETVSRLVRTFKLLYEMNGMQPELARHIGIIVPFRAQIAMIRTLLAQQGIADADNLTIDTVERYQGSQRDIIIFNTTVSRPDQLPALSETVLTEGQEIDRKLNVALTRARKQLFLVGNRDLLVHAAAYKDLIEYIPQENFYPIR